MDATPFLSAGGLPWLAWLSVGLVAGAGLAALLSVGLWRRRLARLEAQRRAELAQAERLPLHQAVATSNDAVVVTDAQRRITWVNQAFERISGYSLDEARGQSPGQLLQGPDTDALTVERMRAALDAGQAFTCEILNRGRHGQQYWLELHIQPVRDAAGTVSAFISIQSDVTDRKRAEAVLRASQGLLDKTGRIGGVGGWVLDLATREVQWTDQTCRMLGAEPGFRPTLQDCLNACAPQAWMEVQQLIKQGLSGRSQWDLELPLRTRQGREFWVRAVAEVEYGDKGAERIVGALQDITHRRELEAQLQRNAELLRGAFDVVDEAFALYDPDDRLVFCNEPYRQLYDASREFMVPGATFEEIIRKGAEAGQYQAAIGRVDEWVASRMAVHRAGNRSLIQRLGNGRILRVVDRKMPSGHTVGFRVDITDLVRATEAAEAADRAKSEFIATISHELRTPLQAITGFSDLGKTFAAGHPQYEPMFTDIHAAGQRMLRLVNGLLDVSKIDGTVGSLALSRGDLGTLTASVVQELRQMAAERHVRFEMDEPPPHLPADVDAFRIQQVVRNVLANALRFAPTGTGIEISGRQLGSDGLELCVRDHGIGIPEHELEAVFEPFVQSSRTRDGSGGTGLGLAISRRIVSAHGGRITAEVAAGGGTLIRIHLPAPLGAAGAESADAAGRPPARRLLRSGVKPVSQSQAA